MARQEKLVTLAQEHLNGEEVNYWVLGSFKSDFLGSTKPRTGVFIATDRQVFFYCKKTFGFETDTFPYSNISSIEAGKGALGYKLSIIASGNKVEMSMIVKGQFPELVDYVRSKIGKPSTSAAVKAETTLDSAEELRKYKALMDDGIISEEDFASKKKQLLGI